MNDNKVLEIKAGKAEKKKHVSMEVLRTFSENEHMCVSKINYLGKV